MKKALLLTFVACLLSLILTGCLCEHEWTDATCNDPQKCSKCNITNGQPNGHNFSAATCKTPKKCTVCGTTEGGVLPHNWTAATCSAPKTCTACNATEGEKLAHTPTNEWVTQKTDYVYAETLKTQTCSACGEVVDRKIIDLTKLHDGTFFLISAEEFTTRLGNTLASYTGNNYKTKGASTGDSYACGVVENGDAICILLFTKNDDMVTNANRNDSGAYNKVMGQCDVNAIIRVSCALIQTADPTINLDDAKKYAEKMLEHDSVSVNGVTYIAMQYSGKYIIGCTIE